MEENVNASPAAAAATETAGETSGETSEGAAAGTDAGAAAGTGEPQPAAAAVSAEEITYHAVEKDGQVTAIWEMQGRKHLRTIDPRSRQGQEILRLYTSEHAEGQ
jgi:hypothetical protein